MSSPLRSALQVDPLPEVDFGKDLGTAISYNFEDHITVRHVAVSLPK